MLGLFLKIFLSLSFAATWPVDAERSAAINTEGEKALHNYLFTDKAEKDNSTKRPGKRTDAALVIQNGRIIYEKYARGYDENKKHIMWSISKTVNALLFGVAIKEKRVSLEQSLCDFTKFSAEAYCKIKVRHVLEWTTGLKWKEEYEKTSEAKKASVLAMLYGEGHADMAEFVKIQPLEKASAPGEVWRYSSGDSILASFILAQVFKGQDLRAVFKEKIFDPIGVENWLWESDAAGTIGGAFYFYTTPRDLARIGELIKNNGVYRGKKLLDADFVKFMKTTPPAFAKKRLDYKGPAVSGASMWLNDPRDTGVAIPWPQAPQDAFVARGHWGQFLVVIPSLDVIAVRTGDTRDESFYLPDWVAQVAALAKEGAQ